MCAVRYKQRLCFLYVKKAVDNFHTLMVLCRIIADLKSLQSRINLSYLYLKPFLFICVTSSRVVLKKRNEIGSFELIRVHLCKTVRQQLRKQTKLNPAKAVRSFEIIVKF